jgi:hypothetical protein
VASNLIHATAAEAASGIVDSSGSGSVMSVMPEIERLPIRKGLT